VASGGVNVETITGAAAGLRGTWNGGRRSRLLGAASSLPDEDVIGQVTITPECAVRDAVEAELSIEGTACKRAEPVFGEYWIFDEVWREHRRLQALPEVVRTV